MKGLRELELVGLKLGETSFAAFGKFSTMQPLERLRIEWNVVPLEGTDPMLAQLVPTLRLEVAIGALEVPSTAVVPAELQNGPAAKHLQTLHFSCWDSEFDANWMTAEHVAALKSYPNLKRVEVRRGGFEDPATQDSFVKWLKTNLPGVEVVVVP
jgi:hypothetical protein